MDFWSIFFIILLLFIAPSVPFHFIFCKTISFFSIVSQIVKSVHAFLYGTKKTRAPNYSSYGAKGFYTPQVLRHRAECLAGRFGSLSATGSAAAAAGSDSTCRISKLFKLFRSNRPLILRNYATKFESAYEMGPKLGSGGFASVFQCSNRRTHVKYACKVLEKSLLPAQYILNEVTVMLEVGGNEHIAQLEDIFETPTQVLLVMHLCKGGSIYSTARNLGRMAEKDAKVIFKQVVNAVRHCHALDVYHMDIKTDNILLKDSLGEGDVRACLVDFGLARLRRPGNTFLPATAGSVLFTAPETLELLPEYGEAAEVWALGCVLYEMLSGEFAFRNGWQVLNMRVDYRSYKPISKDARSLLQSIFTEKSKRPSLEAIWKHPFLNMEEEEGEGEGKEGKGF